MLYFLKWSTDDAIAHDDLRLCSPPCMDAVEIGEQNVVSELVFNCVWSEINLILSMKCAENYTLKA
jgi:hypothetical protein